MKNLFAKLFNRETVSYVFFGALTTLVNIVVAVVSYRLLLPTVSPVAANLLSNTAAWICAVAFAFAVNRAFVFRSHTHGKALLREWGLFVAARLASFAVDAAGMVLLVDVLTCPYGVAKIATNVLVLLLNYIFSKLVIFRK